MKTSFNGSRSIYVYGCRSDTYNLDLSKLKTASTLEYLVIQGIERNRLKSIVYGEMQHLNECVKEGICTQEQYNINRHCEYTILN